MTEPLLAEARACVERGTTLPPRCYTDPDLHARELERIFRREWLPLCRADQLREPGEYLALDLAGEPLVAVRGRDGRLRVLSNVCRHRFMPLVSGAGRANAFQCPYHLWSYGLDGQLLGAPGMEGARGFERAATRLPELRSETWQGFLFVNLDGAAPPLAPRLAALDERLARYRLAELVTLASLDYESAWNWKVMLENAAESYHHMGPHAGTLEPVLPALRTEVPPQQGDFLFWRNPTRAGDLPAAAAPLGRGARLARARDRAARAAARAPAGPGDRAPDLARDGRPASRALARLRARGGEGSARLRGEARGLPADPRRGPSRGHGRLRGGAARPRLAPRRARRALAAREHARPPPPLVARADALRRRIAAALPILCVSFR
jgi:nitrite reductase/ring-hydroxylating ferredoxin subunit